MKFFDYNICPHFKTLNDLKNEVLQSVRTKCVSYVSCNSELSIHPVYSQKHSIPEFQRMIFTRLRLSSHNLRIETGRWCVPPIPLHDRQCVCNSGIQDESHIIETCSLTDHIRHQNPQVIFSKINILHHLNA